MTEQQKMRENLKEAIEMTNWYAAEMMAQEYEANPDKVVFNKWFHLHREMLVCFPWLVKDGKDG